MKIIISGQHLEKNPQLEQYAAKRVQKLGRYFKNVLKLEVRLIREKAHRNQLHSSACKIIADIPGRNLEIVERDESMDKAIDRAVERMHRLLVKTKEKKLSIQHREGIISKLKGRFF